MRAAARLGAACCAAPSLLCACLLASTALGARVTFFGSSGKDRMRGNALANTMWGGRSGDRMFGLGGNDTLRGGTGRDTLARR